MIARNFRTIALATILSSSLIAHAFSPADLVDAEIVSRGQFLEGKVVLVCFLVKKNDKFYLVPVDNKGAVAIYEVARQQQDYSQDQVKYLWSRSGA